MLPCVAYSQMIPPKAKTIVVKGVTFTEVLNALLDKGYGIEKKDTDLQTARTEAIKYPRYWNGAYKINVRVKDSTAYFTGIYKCPYDTQLFSGALAQNEKDKPWDVSDFIYHATNKKGETQAKHMIGYPFLLMNDFVKGLGKQLEYKTE